jgi:hypothetical protein
MITVIVPALPGCGTIGWICDKTEDTGKRMAEQTVFNADKHVWTYEQFKKNKADFDQYSLQYKKARKEMDRIEKLGNPSSMQQRYESLSMELDGSRNMMARISAEYNKMSNVAYQQVWKSMDDGLPERLDMPE